MSELGKYASARVRLRLLTTRAYADDRNRLLEELDQELMVELDEVVQANQLAYMPFARSNRALEQLLDHHMGLAEQVEQSRQRRIDSMRLRSRLVEDEQRSASYHKFRVGSLDGSDNAAASQRKLSRASRALSPGQSPSIDAADMTDELQFEMDEDTATRRPATGFSSPTLAPLPPDEEEELSTSLGQTPESTRKYIGDAEEYRVISSPISATPAFSISGVSDPKPPWQTSPSASKKVDLKDIMEQTSASRVSSLTQSLEQADATSKPGQRMSQKERKRQLQRQKTQEPGAQSQPSSIAAASPKNSQSPWHNVKQQQTNSDTLSSQARAKQETEATILQSRETMSARPTVTAGPSTRNLPAAKPARSSSSPNVQSIRHIPMRSPSTVDARTSMAAILAQQQTEKTAVKEAVAKRSLQEIQQEQEFQEWWDKESRRIQEEEAPADATTSRRGKGGRERGRQRGKGRSGAGGQASSDAQGGAAVQQASREKTRVDRARGSRGEGRGRGRGRGR